MNIFTLVLRVIDPIRTTWNRRDELGASLVEYALLLALIAVVALVALHFLGGSVANTLNSVGSSVNNPTRHRSRTGLRRSAIRSRHHERRETVNIVSLVMHVINPIRATWNRRDELGASLVEYALLLALIAVVALVALHFLGGSVANTLNSVGSSVNNPTGT